MTDFNFSELFKNLGGMKTQMEQIKQRVATIQVTGEAGAGFVRITMNGEGQVNNIKIDPTMLSPDSQDMLEELLISAFNDAQKKAREAMAHEMKGITGGIPGLEKFFNM